MLRSLSTVLATTVAIIVTSLTPAPVQAQPSSPRQSGASTNADPTITYYSCGYTGGTGAFYCEVDYTSTGPAQIRWTLNGTPMPWWDDQKIVQSGCQIGYTQYVRVTVTSPYGSSSLLQMRYCGPGEADG